jgi:hypothetical protein
LSPKKKQEVKNQELVLFVQQRQTKPSAGEEASSAADSEASAP